VTRSEQIENLPENLMFDHVNSELVRVVLRTEYQQLDYDAEQLRCFVIIYRKIHSQMYSFRANQCAAVI